MPSATSKAKTETKAELDARFTREMAECFADLRALGMIDEATYKRTLRDLNREAGKDVIVPLTGGDSCSTE